MVELVRQTEKGVRVADRLATDGGPYVAPHLVDPEVMQAFRSLVRVRQIDHFGQHRRIAQVTQALRQPAIEQCIRGFALASIRLVKVIRNADDCDIHASSGSLR